MRRLRIPSVLTILLGLILCLSACPKPATDPAKKDTNLPPPGHLLAAAGPSYGYQGYPGLGFHALNWLETATNTATTITFYGDNGTTLTQTGIFGQVWN